MTKPFTELPRPEQLPLIETFTVHCFFYARCKHVVKSHDPEEAHRLMEQHYTDSHAAQIAAFTGSTTRAKQ